MSAIGFVSVSAMKKLKDMVCRLARRDGNRWRCWDCGNIVLSFEGGECPIKEGQSAIHRCKCNAWNIIRNNAESIT